VADGCDIEANSSARGHNGPVDAAIGALAARLHDVVAREQLLTLGLTPAEIKYRLRIGRLQEVLPRVYTVGTPSLTAFGRLMAAALWAAPDAVISHASAAFAWGIRSRGTATHLTVPRRPRPRPGIVLHGRHLPEDERDRVEGIPVTSLARTLLDIAAAEGPGALERALREAEYGRLSDPIGLPRLIARYPGRAGVPAAARVLEQRRWLLRTRGELEDAFLELLDEAGLSPPRTNSSLRIGADAIEPDCAWPERRLIVELDGVDAHRAPERFESDRRRDARLLARGWRVRRVTWRRVHHERAELTGELRALLGSGAARP
jgi:very-short-patch-repair endonuclease